MMRQYELVELVTKYDPDADEDLLNRAYVYAMKAHGNQKRASGEAYFNHPLEVAAILTEMKLDAATIAAALLHDTVEDTEATQAEVEEKFDIPRIAKDVLESQQARLMMFEALKRGAHFPWDFQPLRDASEQYTRNHMSVTDRDLKSRFPRAPDIESKRN